MSESEKRETARLEKKARYELIPLQKVVDFYDASKQNGIFDVMYIKADYTFSKRLQYLLKVDGLFYSTDRHKQIVFDGISSEGGLSDSTGSSESPSPKIDQD